MRRVHALVIVMLALAAPAAVRAQDGVLFRYDGVTLRDSRWGSLAALQGALNVALRRCALDTVLADGIFGLRTAAALERESVCSGEHPAADADSVFAIDSARWQRLAPGVPIPGVHARAFVLALSHEGTDYDRVEWNYGTGDDRSALTWGPFGATVGYGNEVRAVLAIVARLDTGLLRRRFTIDYPLIDSLLRLDADQGYALLRPAFADSVRRIRIAAAFALLGGDSVVRAAYDAYALHGRAWLRPAIERLYGLVPDGTGTEVDYAFFLDVAVHMSVTAERVHHCADSLAAATRLARRALTPGERRRVIAHVMIPTRRRADRMGRNVVYFVDAVGADHLSDDERAAWLARTGRRASDCGLSDNRRYTPENYEF